MHCFLSYHFLLLHDFKHCVQKCGGSVARGPSVFAHVYGKTSPLKPILNGGTCVSLLPFPSQSCISEFWDRWSQAV